jgi:3-oxoacyl-[acyl-carrier protein] reductase
MMAQGRGRVINISSIIASTGFNALAVYAATKASLVGFTKSLAREVGRVGVTVNAIAPGFIDTEMTGELDESNRKRIIGRSALRRLAAPEDIAAMAALLMGEGGRNITGAVMTVDAGGTA